MIALRLWPLVWREWRHHPWRHGVALLAVALGVALAWSVHLINRSALGEFAAAVRSANGVPDLSLRGQREGFDESLFARVLADPAVQHASPVVELDTYARGTDGTRVALRVLGVDVLRLGPLAPALLPLPGPGESPRAAFDADVVFLNAAARSRLPALHVELQSGQQWQTLRVAGEVAASGSALALMDIAGAQERFGLLGRLSRIDLRLAPGTKREALLARLQLPGGVQAVATALAEQRVSELSRAYRVNLTVLALVALFVGAFLVFSVLSLSVAQRTPALALLGVLGLTAGERRTLVLGECAALGGAGSALGLALGTAMAAAALHWLAGDLGGGYFPGVAPALDWSSSQAALFGMLGVASALAGGWWPARAAERLAPALALKGLGLAADHAPRSWPGLALVAAGVALAGAPPVAGLPLAAYVAVAALLCGGVALVPAAVHALLARRRAPQPVLALLAWRRARHQRATASAASAGVVASLALSVALTVMVASFRDGVAQWLDRILPADLYARTAASSSLAEQAWLEADFPARAAALRGVAGVQASRVRALQLAPGRPAVALVARELRDPAGTLPLVAPALPPHPALLNVFVSEATAALYDAAPGARLQLPLGPQSTEVHVRGVFRDFARQFGTVAIDRDTYIELTGDTRVNELALWLQPGADAAQVQAALRALLPDATLLDFATSGQLRAISLRIFDRSFAVTYYLQAVAIAIGLVGIAASLSAQVLARRKEFGLLAHLGLTRGQLIAVVTGETAAWVAAGTLVGLLLGLAVSAVLVFVVNPQSFHWTMQIVLPAGHLALLCVAVFAAGTATAAISARGATARAAVLAVKEDW